MRSLKDNSSLTPVLIDADYPNGRIIDETLSIKGTAVIEEIYGDILVNLYKLLQTVGAQTNATADNEGTSYQIVDAIQKTVNILTGVEQPLTLSSTTFSIPIAIDYLPAGCVMVVNASSAATAGMTYSFKGTGSLTYNFVAANGFSAGDEVLIIIKSSGVKAFSYGGGVPSSGYVEFTASDLLGSDPFFFLPLSGSVVPKFPKYLTMYIQNGDGDNQNKMIAPAYIADTRIIQGMPSPTDWPSQVIKLYYA